MARLMPFRPDVRTPPMGSGRKVASILLAVAALTGSLLLPERLTRPAEAVPVTYDATKDFSATTNPNGVWTYGYETTGGAAFVPYTATISTFWVGNIGGDGTPVVGVNSRGYPAFGVDPGQLALHPGPSGQPAVLRWTAPAGIDPLISIAGQFFAGDNGTMQVGIFLNNDWGTPLFQATDHGSFSLSRSVSAGDTIDFAVYGGYSSGSTPLDAVITANSNSSPVPEIDPAGLGSIVALVTSSLGLLEQRRRKSA